VSRLIPLLVLFLAACVQGGPATTTAFRPADAPIWSSAAFDMGRIEGRWRQAATFSADIGPGCRAGGAEFSRGPKGMTITARLCLNGREVAVSGPLRMVGPGRMAVPGMADWWVIWVDSGYRTLAVGTPDGTFGFVLDRGQIGRDRLVAAGEVFDFNGYSSARMLPF
jgi:apolipoprotein D and lipocalin family protein